jgi:hypothetical protein
VSLEQGGSHATSATPMTWSHYQNCSNSSHTTSLPPTRVGNHRFQLAQLAEYVLPHRDQFIRQDHFWTLMLSCNSRKCTSKLPLYHFLSGKLESGVTAANLHAGRVSTGYPSKKEHMCSSMFAPQPLPATSTTRRESFTLKAFQISSSTQITLCVLSQASLRDAVTRLWHQRAGWLSSAH